jgi:hypothetical protein
MVIDMLYQSSLKHLTFVHGDQAMEMFYEVVSMSNVYIAGSY